MGGGILNLLSTTTLDVILTGNPDITFFKKKYRKYVNYGMQYFDIKTKNNYNLDYNNVTYINLTIPRYGDLINDSYLVITIPDIYSEPPIENYNYCPKFKWIRDLGYNIIKKLSIIIGGQLITEYSGEYLINLRDRENTGEQVHKNNQMTGNIPELYDPKSIYGGKYPNSYKSSSFEPSIRGRRLYIPINAWFCNDPSLALPLISLQYQEVNIKLELRPIKELFVVSNKLIKEDIYINNFLFNEFPDMHNINFIVKNNSDIIPSLTDIVKTILESYDFTENQNELNSYTNSIISYIKNGNYVPPQTPQHIGFNAEENTKFEIRSYPIDNNNNTNLYTKIYIYIDKLLISNQIESKDPEIFLITTDLNTIQSEIISEINNNDSVFFNSFSSFISCDVYENITDNNDKQINPPYKKNKEYINQYLHQNEYKNIDNDYREYNAPDYVNFDDNDNIPPIDISQFLLNGNNTWEANIHLISKYIFLDDKERGYFAKRPQSYLIKTNYNEEFLNLNVPNSLKINSKDLVVNYMWTYRRSDAFERNEWSNYTNWRYTNIPNIDVTNINTVNTNKFFVTPFIENGNLENNEKNILKSLSIIIDGKIREEIFEQGVYNYIEKYLKCLGKGRDGQYFYSFALDNNYTNTQPTGSMNMSKYDNITFEFTLINTPKNTNFEDVDKSKNVQLAIRDDVQLLYV